MKEVLEDVQAMSEGCTFYRLPRHIVWGMNEGNVIHNVEIDGDSRRRTGGQSRRWNRQVKNGDVPKWSAQEVAEKKVYQGRACYVYE